MYNNPVVYMPTRQPYQPNYAGGLERIAYSAATVTAPQANFIFSTQSWTPDYAKTNNYGSLGYVSGRSSVTYVTPAIFLKPSRTKSQFIKSAIKIEPFIRETFQDIMGEPFSKDVEINVVNEVEMRNVNRNWHRGILGFAYNRLGFGTSEIFLLENDLDVLLLTAGHEIGHVTSFPVKSKIMEEAKAFAFEAAWVRSIFRRNIAGLARSISFDAFNPADNGVHDVAFDFVRRKVFFGENPLSLFRKISNNEF